MNTAPVWDLKFVQTGCGVDVVQLLPQKKSVTDSMIIVTEILMKVLAKIVTLAPPIPRIKGFVKEVGKAVSKVNGESVREKLFPLKKRFVVMVKMMIVTVSPMMAAFASQRLSRVVDLAI